VRERIVEKLRLLRAFPEMGKAMSGEYAGWRITPVAMFQIIYRITPTAVEVLFIRHAKRQLPEPPQVR
jgi:plasmid stabilization system protein ParE